ncbi:MAG TPA: DNA polymerase III subunit chi [Devosia sp.]|nr:DNA polymerase III subunit chi [Devosia sp.]
MTDVLFYHLEIHPLERVIPVLLEKTLERGWKAVVETTSRERAEALEVSLWTYRDESFLPHGVATGQPTDALQPVLITAGNDNPNGANVRFFVDRAVPRETAGYDRIVFMFSGHDPDAMSEARLAWKAMSAIEGNAVTYWQQDSGGRWVRKAESKPRG